MAELQFKTRGMVGPQGKSRVYFCCHPEDYKTCFPQLSQEILQHRDCALWYLPEQQRPEDFWEELSQMQLFVVPVTKRLLTEDSIALRQEIPFAIDRHIPILPVVQEPGLEEIYPEKLGNLQYLDRFSQSETALRYEEKLQKFLDTVLGADQLIARVRDAFDAYVFLSYRKKDRRLAQELMRLIHKNDFCRDIAIWYDEYLTPGEDFNDSIRKAMEQCQLFVLTVTPNLVGEPNYVQREEYPFAQQLQKTILPIEMATTDREELLRQYAQLPPCADGRDEDALAQMLRQALEAVALRRKNDPMHTFFMGVAYLSGIDVEVDFPRAVQLITAAAEEGVTAAAEMLVHMYGTGHGVAWDTEKMLCWQERLLDYRRRDYQAEPGEETGVRLLEDLRALADARQLQGQESYYRALVRELGEISFQLYQRYPTDEVAQHLAAAFALIGDLYRGNGEYSMALERYESSENMLLKHLVQAGMKLCLDVPKGNPRADAVSYPEEEVPSRLMIMLADLCSTLCNEADILQAMGNTDRADHLYLRTHEYLETDVMRYGWPDRNKQLSVIYSRLGDMEQRKGKLFSAKQWYWKALAIDEQRYQKRKENGDPFAIDAYARGCLQLAVADPQNPELFYLNKAVSLFKELVVRAPDISEYREYVAELEPYLEACNKHAITLHREKLRRIQNDPDPSEEDSLWLAYMSQEPWSREWVRKKKLNHAMQYGKMIKNVEEAQQEALRRLEERRRKKLPKMPEAQPPEPQQREPEKETAEPQPEQPSPAEYYEKARKIFADPQIHDKREAVEALGKIGASGQPCSHYAFYYLGICYEKGLGARRDHKKAFDCYGTAARNGNIWAIYRIARCWELGIGCEKSKRSAVRSYLRSPATWGHLYYKKLALMNLSSWIEAKKKRKAALAREEKAVREKAQWAIPMLDKWTENE